jgi:hypothetical protein
MSGAEEISDVGQNKLRALMLPALFYGLVSILFCAPLFSRPDGLGANDWDQHLFYYASVLKSVVEYGQPPFWNPWYCGGNVLWQNPQVAVLSPVYPLTAIMSLPMAVKVNILLHYWLGFMGMHLLLTRTIGLTFLPLVVYLASVVTAAGAPAMHLAVGHSWILAAFYLPLQLFLFFRALNSSAVSHVLMAGAVLALMVYNGGLHIVAMSIAGIGTFAVFAAIAKRQWRPVILAAALFAAGFSYAAPKLVPVAMFVTDERFWDTRQAVEHPDRVPVEVLLRSYLDPFQHRNSRFEWQRHPWHEYGNYIGGLAAFLILSSIVWILVSARERKRWLGLSLALTSLVLLGLSAGEFGGLSPASLASHLPFFSNLRIPSRYTVPFVLFAALTAAWALRAVTDETVLTGRTRLFVIVVCLLASFDLVARNRTQFKGVFTQPPLDTAFRLLKGPSSIVADRNPDPYGPNSPMLRGLMSDRAFFNCYENFQLKRTADTDHPLVFTDGKSTMFSTTFSPNRIGFAVLGGLEPSRVLLNQNYSPGWRSAIGPVTLDPQYGRPAVTLERDQTGKFAFAFVPPGLVLGFFLFGLGIVGSVLAWQRAERHAIAGGGVRFPTDSAAERVLGRWESVLIAVGFALLFFAVPHAMFADGQVRFAALTDLVEHGRLANVPYSLIGPLFSTPLYYIGKLWFSSEWWCARFNTLLVAGGLIATASLLRRSVDARLLRAFCLLTVAASMFPNHVRDYFGEVFTAVFVLVGLAAISSGRPTLGWTAMVLGVANTPATTVGLLLVAIKRVFDTRRARYFIPVVAAASLILFESWIRRGHPFVTGYEGNVGFRTVMPYSGRPGFSYPFLFGLFSIVLSFGKGLLFFAPGLLQVGRDDEAPNPLRELIRYSMWFLAGLILVYAKWWAWYGGWIWGPRFFLIASVPASLAIAIKLQELQKLSVPTLAALLGVLTLSAWVGVNGAVFDKANLRICSESLYALEFLCWYTPEFSVLWHPFIARAPLSESQWLFIAYCGVVYVWLSAPLMKTLLSRASDLFAVRVTELRSWRF